jgi:hypothetical protein
MLTYATWQHLITCRQLQVLQIERDILRDHINHSLCGRGVEIRPLISESSPSLSQEPSDAGHHSNHRAVYKCQFRCGVAGSSNRVSAHQPNCVLNPQSFRQVQREQGEQRPPDHCNTCTMPPPPRPDTHPRGVSAEDTQAHTYTHPAISADSPISTPPPTPQRDNPFMHPSKCYDGLHGVTPGVCAKGRVLNDGSPQLLPPPTFEVMRLN